MTTQQTNIDLLKKIKAELAYKTELIEKTIKIKIKLHADKIRSGAVPVDPTPFKKKRFDSAIEEDEYKKNGPQIMAGRIYKILKWCAHFEKQPQFKSGRKIKLEISAGLAFPKLGDIGHHKPQFNTSNRFGPPGRNQIGRNVFCLSKQEEEAMERFRNAKQEMKKYEIEGAWQESKWNFIDKEPSKKTMRDVFGDMRFISPTADCGHRALRDLKDVESDRRGRERHPNKLVWPLVQGCKQVEAVLKSYNACYGYGFVYTKNGDYYIHASSFIATYRAPEIEKKLPDYLPGQKLLVDVVRTPNDKREAVNVKPHEGEFFVERYPDRDTASYDLVKFEKPEVLLPGEAWLLPRD